MTLTVPEPHELLQHVGRELGPSDWIAVDQALSLVPRLAATLLRVEQRRHGLNYGSNKVRFIHPVPAGSRVRLRQRLLDVQAVAGGGVRVTSEMVVEIEGQERPALVAETISIAYG